MSCMFAMLTPTTAIVVGIVVLLLFGNRLPSVMRSLGEGMTEFKKGLEGADKSKEPKQTLEESAEK